MSTVAVVVFPGTNCEHDVVGAYAELGVHARLVHHTEVDLGGFDAIVLPGGFSYGDYLRPGAIARFAPVMASVVAEARRGVPVLGICNGFQVLCEAGLLPGALQKNAGLSFLCQDVEVEVVQTESVLTRRMQPGERLSVPINHFEGNYTADAATLAELEGEGRVVLRYVDNPNGSVHDIAGVCDRTGRIVGLMPHPERAGGGFGLTEAAARLLEGLLG